MYLVWKHETDSPAEFKQKLLAKVSEQLVGLGVHKLCISVVDEDVAPADPLRMVASKPPISGMISIWVDTAINRKPLEDVIESAVARMAGYLVTESEPIVNTKHAVAVSPSSQPIAPTTKDSINNGINAIANFFIVPPC